MTTPKKGVNNPKVRTARKPIQLHPTHGYSMMSLVDDFDFFKQRAEALMALVEGVCLLYHEDKKPRNNACIDADTYLHFEGLGYVAQLANEDLRKLDSLFARLRKEVRDANSH